MRAHLAPGLLGLAGEAAGEAGALLAEYKKLMRDGPAHQGFRSQVGEEVGDLLWYLANIATKCDLSLGTLAEQNLAKTRCLAYSPMIAYRGELTVPS